MGYFRSDASDLHPLIGIARGVKRGGPPHPIPPPCQVWRIDSVREIGNLTRPNPLIRGSTKRGKAGRLTRGLVGEYVDDNN